MVLKYGGSCKGISVSLAELQRRGIDIHRRQNKHRMTYQRDARGVKQTIGCKNGIKKELGGENQKHFPSLSTCRPLWKDGPPTHVGVAFTHAPSRHPCKHDKSTESRYV